jgi:hypothetical protein
MFYINQSVERDRNMSGDFQRLEEGPKRSRTLANDWQRTTW